MHYYYDSKVRKRIYGYILKHEGLTMTEDKNIKETESWMNYILLTRYLDLKM